MILFRNITVIHIEKEACGMKRAMPEIVALGVYDASLVQKKAVTPPRRVHMYEIELVTEDGGVSHIDSASYPVRAHRLIVAKPGQMRHTELPFKCLYIHLLVDDPGLCALLDALPDCYMPTDIQAVDISLHTLIEAYTEPDTDGGMHIAARLCAHLSLLLKDARLNAGTAREQNNRTRVVEQAIAFIDETFQRNITLDDVARHVHLSRIYFHNLFAAATGKTPHRYLLERRISYAKQLLITTDSSLSEIAVQCGFSSQSYFHQVFARELGCSPLQYKKQMSLQY